MPLKFNPFTGNFDMVNPDTGITTLNGLTPTTQTFADVDDTNVTLTISSATSTHTFTMGWDGQLAIGRGGTGLSALGTALQSLRVNAGATALEYYTPTSGTVTSVATAGLISGGTITSTGTITTSMATNKLVGRSTAGTGVMEEIIVGSGLTLSGGTLSASGGSGITIGTTSITSGTDTRILYQDGTVVAQDSTLRWNKTLDYLYVNSTTLSTPGVSSNIFLGTYPTAIVAGGGAANLVVGSGAGATITSGTAITALGVNCCSTATAALFAVGIGFQAFLNATPTRGFAAGGSGQANNAGTDSFSLGSLSMVNATNEVETIMIGTNSGIGCTVGFWNVGIGASTVYAAGGAAYGNVVIGRAAGQTVGGSFGANRNTIIGYTADATAGLTGVIALGAGAIAKTSNTIVIGGTVSAPTRMYIGLGETSATPTSITISPTNAVGTNIAGADLILAASQPTGSGAIGVISFSTSTVGASGTTLRSLTKRARMDETVFKSETSSSFLMPFVAGSATAPTYSFVGDTNTGMYSDSADVLRFSTSGTLRTTINTAATLHTLRNEQSKGADVTAANDLTLGKDGNGFVITGNTQINAITIADWQAGSVIHLVFTGTPTVKHNTAGGAGTAVLQLEGSVDLVAANNTTLSLMYDGTQWQELSRKVA